MFDTVRFTANFEGLEPQEPLKAGFSAYPKRIGVDRQGEVLAVNQSWGHEETGLRFGVGPSGGWVEVSWPRLLFPDNGRLVRSHADVTAGWRRLRELLGQAFGQAAPVDLVERLTRVDLVGQFRSNPVRFLVAHKACRHPAVRKSTVDFFSIEGSEEVWWKGVDNQCRMYDKTFELRGKPGDVVRVEWQLRGRSLEKRLGSDPGHLEDLGACYQAYKCLCEGFQPQAVYTVRTQAEILRVCEIEGLHLANGQTVTELWASMLRSKSAKWELRKKVQAAHVVKQDISWQELLPKIYDSRAFVDVE